MAKMGALILAHPAAGLIAVSKLLSGPRQSSNSAYRGRLRFLRTRQ
jgi:hypothetical protein